MVKFECTRTKSIFKAKGITEVVLAQSIQFVLEFFEWIDKKEKDPEAQEALKKLFIILSEKIISSGYDGMMELIEETLKKEAENK